MGEHAITVKLKRMNGLAAIAEKAWSAAELFVALNLWRSVLVRYIEARCDLFVGVGRNARLVARGGR